MTLRWLAVALLIGVVTRGAIAQEFSKNEIAGVVTDDDGVPIEGGQVDGWTSHRGNEMKTGADGKFHLKGINGMKNRDLGTEIVEIQFTKAGLSPVYFRSQPLGVSDLQVRMNARTYLEGK